MDTETVANLAREQPRCDYRASQRHHPTEHSEPAASDGPAATAGSYYCASVGELGLAIADSDGAGSGCGATAATVAGSGAEPSRRVRFAGGRRAKDRQATNSLCQFKPWAGSHRRARCSGSTQFLRLGPDWHRTLGRRRGTRSSRRSG